jgi:queuine tRNA-ribosyltransferase
VPYDLFHLQSTDGGARRGVLTTSHGTVQTPTFMPVGTSGAVKALTAENLEECGAEIILGNTYHLYLRPGHDVVKTMGGIVEFTGWRKPMLTDSGGFQVFSLKDISRVNDEGVEFKSHIDGSAHFFTPEKVIEIQQSLGADIIMPLDQCVPHPSTESEAAAGVRRTTEWAAIAERHHKSFPPIWNYDQHLFGIVQGSTFPHLRKQSAGEIISIGFPGYAIGGLAVGESKQEMVEMLAYTAPLLPHDRPRYLMGVGYPEDLLRSVSYGVDMFDCVLPTRNARTGCVFTSEGPLVFRNAEYTRDERPLDPNCDCKVCKRYSRAYLRHLFNQSEITGIILATYHSTWFYQKLMMNIRLAIASKRFEQFRSEFLAKYQGGLNLEF